MRMFPRPACQSRTVPLLSIISSAPVTVGRWRAFKAAADADRAEAEQQQRQAAQHAFAAA
jgi:heme oxygenase